MFVRGRVVGSTGSSQRRLYPGVVSPIRPIVPWEGTLMLGYSALVRLVRSIIQGVKSRGIMTVCWLY